MGSRYVCKNEQRRRILRDAAALDLNGIDYLEVLDRDAPQDSPRQRTLLVGLFKDSPWVTGPEQLRIEGGVRVRDIRVDWVLRAGDASPGLVAAGQLTEAEKNLFLGLPDRDRVLVLRTCSDGDYSTYALRLVLSPTRDEPPPGFDPILSRVEFSFKVECPSEFDCGTDEACPPAGVEQPVMDYLAKDYASFRKLLLDRLSVTLPGWEERSPADVGIALVEVLAYAADYLSYYQDAVATEAYLGTARRRSSVRRHARLLDYPMHEGCNARTWVQFQVAGKLTLPAHTPVLSQVGGQGPRITPDSTAHIQALAQQPVVFETLHGAELFPGHNRMAFHTWGDQDCCLPAGATRATLQGDFPDLKPGEVLVFIEERGPDSGLAADADPAHRHAVRLTAVTPALDPLGGQFREPPDTGPVAVTEIAWMAGDALPFPLCLRVVDVPAQDRQAGDPARQAVSAILGNIMLADHGRTLAGETLPPPAGRRRYRPRLRETGLTYRLAYDHAAARTQAAARSLRQNPRQALPEDVLLHGAGNTWVARRDLLASDRFATEFVVETETDGGAGLRFGDGIFGRPPAPSETLTVQYRIGNGRAGNIGAEALAHGVTVEGITRVRNPLPAQGGADPESLEAVRISAPQAFRGQERAVTEADYAAVAQRHPEVQKAVATRRWTGSWYTQFLTVDRKGGLPVDAPFEGELRLFLERFRLAGEDLEIDGPRFVALDLVFVVCVQPNYYRGEVKAALLEVFASRERADGRRGFFHPDQFTFGQSVYLSRIVAAAMELPGVRWIDTADRPPIRFRRWGETARDELEQGRIPMGRLEIARLDNDPSRPEQGRLEFVMEGGL